MSRSPLVMDPHHLLPPAIDASRDRYPFCVVWTPIPFITWILPFVGHIGICDSLGRIHDFQGDYTIGDGRMLFGSPVKYWDVSTTYIPSFYNGSGVGKPDPDTARATEKEITAYDAAVAASTRHFRASERYNFFTNNCHTFVASALNEQRITLRLYHMVNVCVCMMIFGKYISFSSFLRAHLPFLVLVAFIVWICYVLS